jgi:hypothetical protein
MSKAKETLMFLANYNSWRRDGETKDMPSPTEIGAAIDDAVNLLRKYDELERENAALRADKERLDWLDTNCVFIAVEGHCDKRLINARHTIDAAQKEKR